MPLPTVGKFEVIGLVINGLSKSVHVLQIGASVYKIVNMYMIELMDALFLERRNKGKGRIEIISHK